MRKTALSMFAILAVGAVALAGCAKDSGQSGATADPVEEGPLDKYWSAIYGGEEWTEEQYQDQDRKREELIARCMADEGFEYIPADSTSYSFSAEDTDGPQWGTLEFAEQYGYGMISWPGMEDMSEEPTDEYVDPNQDYVESLSPSEQEAYWSTLYGAPMTEEDMELQEEDEEGASYYEYDWTTNGCWGWADHELNGETSNANFWEDPEFEDMMTALESMYTTLYEGNADLAALDAEWAACMAESGFDGMTTKMAAQDTLYEEYNALYSSGGDDDEWVEPAKEKVDQFQAQEIKQAVADWKCSDKMDYDKRYRDIEIRAQEEFVAKYKDQLEAMVAKYSQQQSS